MSFSNYRSDSFTDSLYKKVDELTYKIVAVTRQVTVVQQFLNEQGITLPEGGGGNSGQDYSAEMVVLQQLVNNIPVPDTYTTISLTEFISRALKAYNIITNYQPHLEHLPILPHQGYETLTWADMINAVKKIPVSFLPNTLQNMYDNVMGSGSGGSGGSGGNYDAEIYAIHQIIDVLPVLPNPPNESLTWPNLISTIKKIPAIFSQTTLQELFDDVDNLKSQGGTGSSGSSSGGDFEARIEALETVATQIPSTFNNTNWLEIVRVVGSFPKPGIDLMKDLTWELVFTAVKKVPHTFQVETLQAMKNVVAAIPDTFNSSSWTEVTDTVKKVPSVFTQDTLQQLYNDVDDLKNNQGGSDEGTGCSNDHEDRIADLERKVSKIPSAITLITWNEVRMKTNILPLLPDLPIETLTWPQVVATIKKVPESFNINTLQSIYNDMDYMRYRIYSIPDADSFNNDTWSNVVNAVTELQQTVGNMISQLHAQSFINLESLQTALNEADGNLQTISDRLQEMQ